MKKPDPEICGPMHRTTPERLKQARLEYIRARRAEGIPDTAIADVIGISQNAIGVWMRDRGEDRRLYDYHQTQAQQNKRALQRLQHAIRHARNHLSDDVICETLNEELTVTK